MYQRYGWKGERSRVGNLLLGNGEVNGLERCTIIRGKWGTTNIKKKIRIIEREVQPISQYWR
jgi:hypothetical protein